MNAAAYNSLCAEHVALRQLEFDVMKAIAVARMVKVDYDDRAFQDALSDLRAERDAIRAQLDAYDGRDEPSPYRMRARYHAAVL